MRKNVHMLAAAMAAAGALVAGCQSTHTSAGTLAAADRPTASALPTSGPVDFSRPATHDAAYRWAHQVLGDVHGNATAIVKLTTVGDTVRVHVTAWNLTPGFHAIHIHQDGVCDPHGEKPFASAGPHLNLGNQPEDMQAGVFPVLLANKQGRAQAEFTDGQFTIADLFGPTGSAVVIHALPDNYANIPNRYSAAGTAGPDSETKMTGDSGARIACGVIGAPKTTPSAAPSKHT